MRELPILFSAPMVRAILDGRKMVTRRLVKGMPLKWLEHFTPAYIADPGNSFCPYGQVGDRLWVRETFKPIASGEVKDGYGEVRYGYAYQADAATIWAKRPTIIHDLRGQPSSGPMQFQQRPWKPSIHMPRAASRITLEVTGVRVERLHDISEEQARDEGVQPASPLDPRSGEPRDDVQFERPHVVGFAGLWNEINGAGSWDANPWVWAVEFKRIEQENCRA